MDMDAEKMKLKLYNTMTQQKEDFVPITPGKVGLYVCGITAYDFSHIGHARAAVSFDVLYRSLLNLIRSMISILLGESLSFLHMGFAC